MVIRLSPRCGGSSFQMRCGLLPAVSCHNIFGKRLNFFCGHIAAYYQYGIVRMVPFFMKIYYILPGKAFISCCQLLGQW
jgi:hypothetical protein